MVILFSLLEAALCCLNFYLIRNLRKSIRDYTHFNSVLRDKSR